MMSEASGLILSLITKGSLTEKKRWLKVLDQPRMLRSRMPLLLLPLLGMLKVERRSFSSTKSLEKWFQRRKWTDRFVYTFLDQENTPNKTILFFSELKKRQKARANAAKKAEKDKKKAEEAAAKGV